MVGNKTTGVLFNGTSQSMSDNIIANNNGHDGVHIKSLAGARLTGCTVNSNGTFGVWLDGTSHSFVSCWASLNGTTNVEIAGSSNFYQGGHTPGAPFGVVIEAGATQSVVTESGVYKGETQNTKDDAVDKNKNCDHNLWFGNFFKTRKPASCIH